MTNHQTAIRIGGLGAVTLALLLAGCSGSGAPAGSTPAGSGIVPNGQGIGPGGVALNEADEDSSGAATPDRRHRHHRSCAVVTNSQNFNGQAIAKGSWIWFSSVTSFPGYHGNPRATMRNSVITFSDGSQTYTIKGPRMHIVLGSNSVDLDFKKNRHRGFRRGRWLLTAPADTAGNDLLNTAAYQVPSDLPGGIKNVTWSAKFLSKANIKSMHWQWAAAVYTQLTDNYRKIGVKPLDDNHYPPYNSDHAGTPENYKAYLTSGATGGGGGNYTGGYGPTVSVTPCLVR